jgi:hypothetical protein
LISDVEGNESNKKECLLIMLSSHPTGMNPTKVDLVNLLEDSSLKSFCKISILV